MKLLKIKKNKENGFIILFAITLSAILLSIALGVADISFKEASFSTSAGDSNDAFLAADTGAECALLYDKLDVALNKFPLAGPPTPITCGTTTVTPTYLGSPISSPTTGVYNFTITGLGSAGDACAKVEVFKDKTTTPTKVRITSTGYNTGDATCNSPTPNNRRVERELVISSYVGATPLYVPPAANVILKCNGADVGTCSYSEQGSNTLLSWTTTGITSNCTASGGFGSWTTPASKSWGYGTFTTGSLSSSQNYVLTCGSVFDNITVTVSTAVPTVTTPTFANVSSAGATLGASVTSLGSPASISARGTCWGTSPAPTTNCAPASGTTTGAFTHSRTGMPSGTLIYYRGYATNTSGTGYSGDSSFMTLSACTDPTGGDSAPVVNGGYRYHTFTNSGTFSTNCSKAVTYLVVAGGGGGGATVRGDDIQSGGGGGGGVLNSSTTLPANSYAVTVGNGGGPGANGGNSIIAGTAPVTTIATAIGGGAGGYNDFGNGVAGGSGGGAGGVSGLSTTVGGAGTSGQGFKGGDGVWGGPSSRAGGGGGAVGAGQPAPNNEDGGAGGLGIHLCLPNCTGYSYGGAGGSGAGGTYGYAGSGGGGGTGFAINVASGVKGIVIIRYVYP